MPSVERKTRGDNKQEKRTMEVPWDTGDDVKLL
jgi:hypothetical protein